MEAGSLLCVTLSDVDSMAELLTQPPVLTEEHNLHPAWARCPPAGVAPQPLLLSANPCSADLWTTSVHQHSWKPCWWNNILLLGGHRPLPSLSSPCLLWSQLSASCYSLPSDLDAKWKCNTHQAGQTEPFLPCLYMPLVLLNKKQLAPQSHPKRNIMQAERKSGTTGC